MGALIPAPFVPVVLLLFTPPLALAWGVQTLCFVLGLRRLRRLRGRAARVLASYPLTLAGCLSLSAALHAWGPHALQAREMSIAARMLPVMPLAFIAAAIVVPSVVVWVLREKRR